MTVFEPRVSVVVLTRNRLRFLRDAVRTLAEQDYSRDRLEIVVVNDGSTDGTREWLDRLGGQAVGIRPVHLAARGIPAARNAGIRAATGDLIAIVADDYLLAPDYVSHFVRFFRRHPAARIVRFGFRPSDRWPGSLLSHLYYEASFRKRLQSSFRPEPVSRAERLRRFFRRLPDEDGAVTADHQLEASGAAAFRRGVFEEVGGFDESLKRAEDTEFTLRLRERGIAIFYDPSHKIVHRYGRWGGDTIRKNYESGIYAARLHARGPGSDVDLGSGGYRLSYRILCLASRMRQASNPLVALLMLPGILVFEFAWQAGYLRERVRAGSPFRFRGGGARP